MKNNRYYLAYGSNLNKHQMKRRCPDAEPIGTVIIPDYELVFRTFATIEPKSGPYVPCAVWRISREDERSLDIYEGFPQLYVKQDFCVELQQQSLRAMAYVMPNGVRPKAPPSTGYLMSIMEGYADFGFDDKLLTIAAAKEE